MPKITDRIRISGRPSRNNDRRGHDVSKGHSVSSRPIDCFVPQHSSVRASRVDKSPRYSHQLANVGEGQAWVVHGELNRPPGLHEFGQRRVDSFCLRTVRPHGGLERLSPITDVHRDIRGVPRDVFPSPSWISIRSCGVSKGYFPDKPERNCLAASF